MLHALELCENLYLPGYWQLHEYISSTIRFVNSDWNLTIVIPFLVDRRMLTMLYFSIAFTSPADVSLISFDSSISACGHSSAPSRFSTEMDFSICYKFHSLSHLHIFENRIDRLFVRWEFFHSPAYPFDDLLCVCFVHGVCSGNISSYEKFFSFAIIEITKVDWNCRSLPVSLVLSKKCFSLVVVDDEDDFHGAPVGPELRLRLKLFQRFGHLLQKTVCVVDNQHDGLPCLCDVS